VSSLRYALLLNAGLDGPQHVEMVTKDKELATGIAQSCHIIHNASDLGTPRLVEKLRQHTVAEAASHGRRKKRKKKKTMMMRGKKKNKGH
jgi:hypothetical protein